MYYKCNNNDPYWKERPIGGDPKWCSGKLRCGRCVSENKETCNTGKSQRWINFDSVICNSCEDRFICYTKSDRELCNYNVLMNKKRQR